MVQESKVNSTKGKTSQSGRSMVEMLGVLAIVGVLSVGGINAYSTAMKKHKANELLKQASMHAVEVSSQIMNDKEPTGLSDFGTGLKIRLDTVGMVGQTTFKLILSDVDGDVCEQLKSMKGGMVRDATCDDTTATLTYYKNLATNDVEGAKSPTGEKEDLACKDVECEEGLTCFHGECKCSNGVSKCGEECCDEGYTCSRDEGGNAYGCVAVTDDSECLSNADCGENEYCKITATRDEELLSCYTDMKGVCTSNTDILYPAEIGIGDIEGLSEERRLMINNSFGSTTKMSWWAAANWCASHGRSLFYKDDFDCKRLSGYVDTEAGYCCLEDKDCNLDPVDQSITLKAFSVAYAEHSHKRVWIGSVRNSCSAFGVYMPTGVTGTIDDSALSNKIMYRALCK